MDGSIKIRTLKKGLNKDKKVYDVFYRYIDPQNGLKKQTSKKGFKKKKEAEEYLLSVQNDIKNNKYIPNRSLTVKKYMTDWYAKAVEVDPDLKQTTKDGYKVNIYNHVIPGLGDKLLSELTKSDIQSFYWKLFSESKLATNTIRYIHRVFNRALEEAADDDVIPKNVANRCKIPGESKFEAGKLDKAQLNTLLKAIKDTEIYVPVALAALCGFRRGEILGLKWTDVILEADKGFIDINKQLVPTRKGLIFSTPKTKTSIRKVPIGANVVAMLRENRSKQEKYKRDFGDEYIDNGLVVCNIDGSLFDPSKLDKLYKKALNKVDLPSIRFHDLRHTYSSLMAAKGVSGKVRAEMMGHAEENITERVYTHAYDDAKEKAAEIVDQLLSEGELSEEQNKE